MESTLGSGLQQDPYFPRPQSAMHFRNAWDSQGPQSDPADDLRLTNYYTTPEPYHNTQGGEADTFYNDPQPSQSQYQYQYAAEPSANSYEDPSYYPGDLATAQGFVETDRSWLSDAVKRNQHVFDKPIEAIGGIIGGVITIVASPFVGALSDLYVEPMRRQLNDGRAKILPAWLRTFCNGKYTFNPYQIRYGEHINLKTNMASAMTIGNDVYVAGGLDLNLDVLNSKDPGITDMYERLYGFAWSVQTMMHEMEHTSQYWKSGGDSHLWITKWAARKASV